MGIVRVNVSEVINSPSALTREQGEKVYNCIVNNIKLENSVILDFNQIESIITPFLNVAIGKLYGDYPSDTIKKYLEIINIPNGKAASFNIVIRNAKSYYGNTIGYENAINNTFENEKG
ncbi:protein of unknown function [Anaerosporobacter mobilis DSM 15930]|jgi:hypothetical protein|uniref:DUF4325 domain-containing protein n=1 Tax=Anaerosporobacter mobilis DSM 15930 TaxID=1120996 RepID=A0A1M7MW91_9FIRM|nr:STAS-like domain-containing protein [Anaerosporobacter mobilis]SHM95314.1 protein of unknown function [Anaerosporobacter mobilis DSM 15930]